MSDELVRCEDCRFWTEDEHIGSSLRWGLCPRLSTVNDTIYAIVLQEDSGISKTLYTFGCVAGRAKPKGPFSLSIGAMFRRPAVSFRKGDAFTLPADYDYDRAENFVRWLNDRWAEREAADG